MASIPSRLNRTACVVYFDVHARTRLGSPHAGVRPRPFDFWMLPWARSATAVRGQGDTVRSHDSRRRCSAPHEEHCARFDRERLGFARVRQYRYHRFHPHTPPSRPPCGEGRRRGGRPDAARSARPRAAVSGTERRNRSRQAGQGASCGKPRGGIRGIRRLQRAYGNASPLAPCQHLHQVAQHTHCE